MQVVNWLPRTELPFAAPSRPELLEMPEPLVVAPVAPVAPAPVADSPVEPLVKPAERVKIEVPRPSLASTRTNAKVEEEAAPVVARAPVVPPPRFALQLLRAGRCLLLVELPTGETFQTRDPAYLLLLSLIHI